MTQHRIPYQFSDDVPALQPLAGRSILVHVVVNVEHWPFDQPMPRTILTPPHGQGGVPDVPNFSWVDYGMRCGLPRMLRALQSRGLRASASFNAGVIDAYPRAAEAIRDAGWEFIGHGLQQRGLQAGAAEAELVAQALDRIEAFTGERPVGWLSPGLRETADTPEVLVQCGLRYVCDWCVDDLPHWMRTRHGPLLAVPYNLELNDSVVYAVEKQSTGELLLRVRRTLDCLRQEVLSLGRPRVLALGLHPHLMGVPHRFGDFEAMLDLLLACPEVGFVTGHEIAQWYADQRAPVGASWEPGA